MIRISVIVTTYCPKPHWMADLIGSLIGVAPAIELVVADNSPPPSAVPDYFAPYRDLFGSFKYIGGTGNVGMFDNYRRGVAAATTEYLTFLDQDDVLYLDAVLQFLESSENFDFLFTDEYKYYGNKSDLNIVKKPDFDILSVNSYHCPHHLSVYRADVAKDVCADTINYPMWNAFDWWLLTRYLLRFDPKSLTVRYLPVACYGWRMHEASTSVDVGVRASLKAERIRIAEDVYSQTGDRGLHRVDSQIGFVLRSRFFNTSTLAQKIGDYGGREAFYKCLQAGRVTLGSWRLRWTGSLKYLNDQAWSVLDRVPLSLMERSVTNALFIPNRVNVEYEDHQGAQERQISGVPMLLEVPASFIHGGKQGEPLGFVLERDGLDEEIRKDLMHAIGFGLA